MCFRKIAIERPWQNFRFISLKITVCQGFGDNSIQKTIKLAIKIQIVIDAFITAQFALFRQRLQNQQRITIKAFGNKDHLIPFIGTAIMSIRDCQHIITNESKDEQNVNFKVRQAKRFLQFCNLLRKTF